MVCLVSKNINCVNFKLNFDSCTLKDLDLANVFQNLKVSSPAPVTIVCPSGDIAF